MTDIQTTTPHDTGLGSATGHLESPLFALLPVELRLKIYEDVFDGSSARLVHCRWYGAPNHDETNDYPDHLYMLRQSGHHWPLLACRALYQEAMPLYWAHTVVDVGIPPHKFTKFDLNNPATYESGTDDIDKQYPSIGDAVCAIPVHARQYIQQITNVKVHGLADDDGPWWLAKGLSYLPSLKTCRLVDVIEMDPSSGPGYLDLFLHRDWDPWHYEQYAHRDDFLIEYCRRSAGFRRRIGQVLFEEPYFAAVVVQKYRLRHPDPEAFGDPDAPRTGRVRGANGELAWPQLVQVCT